MPGSALLPMPMGKNWQSQEGSVASSLWKWRHPSWMERRAKADSLPRQLANGTSEMSVYLEKSTSASTISFEFAPKKHVNGGFYLSPSIGASYKLKGSHSLSLSVGYELQEYSQLLSCENARFLTQYVEDISNHAITASIGFTFWLSTYHIFKQNIPDIWYNSQLFVILQRQTK